MSADRDVTRIVRSWLREERHEDAGRVLDMVLAELDTTPQRRSWWPARRFPIMNSNRFSHCDRGRSCRPGCLPRAEVPAVVYGY